MFASHAYAALQGVGYLWVPTVLAGALLVTFWRFTLRIVAFVFVVLTITGIVALVSLLHQM
jgi:hypothetical protein